MLDFSRYNKIGEPTWDFLSDVNILYPEYFPYDIENAEFLATLARDYQYCIEVRGELTHPSFIKNDDPLPTWTQLGRRLGRPVLPFRDFRQAFGKMSDETFQSQILTNVDFPFNPSLQLFWYPLRAELGPPQYFYYLWEGFDMPPYEEHTLNGHSVLTGSFTGEVKDAGFGGTIFATAAWHSNKWLIFLARCGTRVIALVNNDDICDKIMLNQDIETTLVWGE